MIERRGARVLALWLLFLAIAALAIGRTRLDTSLSAFLPKSPDAEQRILIEQLASGIAARSLLIGIEGGSAAQRAAASRALAARLIESGLFEQVQNGASDGFEAAGRWLFEHRYLLSPSVAPERYTIAGLRDAIDETLSLLGTPAGGAIKPSLASDPTGETLAIAEALIPAGAPRNEDGVWVSRSHPRALLLASTRAAGGDLDAQATAIARVRSEFQALAAPELRVVLSGPAVFSVQSRAQIQAEIRRLALAGGVLISLLLWFAFASLPALLVALLPVLTGIAAGVVAVSFSFGSVHGITLGFGSTLIGESVDYAIYYLIQARGGGAAHWLRHSWPTVRLGLLTSVCGFAALLFSGFPGLAQLGLFSFAGLVAAALATRYLLPVLTPHGASGAGVRQQLARVATGAMGVMPKLRYAVLALGALCVGWLVWQGAAVWRGDLASLSPVPEAAIKLDAELRADLSVGDASTFVVVQQGDLEATLRSAETVSARLDPLVEQGVLGGYDTPARLLPSRATQERRIASLPGARELAERVEQATAGGPLRAERLGPFVEAVEAARKQAPLDAASIATSPLASIVDALLLRRTDGSAAALIALQSAAPGALARVRDALHDVPNVRVIDVRHELQRLYAHYLREALLQALLGACAVVVLLAFRLRSLPRLMSVCLPLALAVLLTLGGLAAAGAPLGILHLVGLLLVVALGSNYVLFFDQLHRAGRTDHDTLASLLLANVTTVVSFGLLAVSAIPSLSSIGRTVAPGALLALLLAAAFAAPRKPATSA